MTRSTQRPAPVPTTAARSTIRRRIVNGAFVSWAPSTGERARDQASRRGDFDTSRVRTLAEDDPRAAFVRALRALGLNACANVMVAKAA